MISNTLPIPDQNHLNRVRDALWSRPLSGASIMVGSGFSRNAVKPRSEVVDLPLWGDIATEIATTLYPKLETLPIEDPLRLAQQYKTSFGRSDLHRLLGQLVRDRNFYPGEAHSRLLKLPWRDIFTTNWDTLLERSSLEIGEPPYSVVEDIDQLPLTSQPRIIKLHGSFPSKFPLIVTEEDYRTYPAKYAPFVNTVQQAMMETIFCLIGFSGDDPNFLQWSGWVRDNLGEAAPKIYLAGLLKLLPHQRRMLEERGVVPIDIWDHPKAKTWPEHQQHQYATQWFLHTLEFGEPYDENLWPSPPDNSQPVIDSRLTPVVRVPFDVPSEQPQTQLPSNLSTYNEEHIRTIREVLAAWKHNRTLYPGWIVFPSGEEHSQLSRYTDQWEPHILRVLPHFNPLERLGAVRELFWRREILVEPITPELAEAAQGILDAVDCETRVVRGNGEVINDWSAVREAWRNITVMLVMDARYECDQPLFERRLTALEPFRDDSPDLGHRIQQERCLWELHSSNFQGLNELLDNWNIENSDPIWMLRKAALLTEMRRHTASFPLVQEALNSIRKDLAGDPSIANASRLGWALGSTLTFTNRRSVYRRWDELASQKCHAWNELDHITRALVGKGERSEAPSFDLGVRLGTTVSWSNEPHTRLIAAYRALRLPEVTGLPPVNIDRDIIRGVPIGASVGILKLAADELAASAPELAIRIMLRICTYDRDKTLLRVTSRTRIASLSDEATDTLARVCIGVIEHTLPRLFTPDEAAAGISSIERLRVALEVLSRLVLRTKPELVAEVLELGLKCYRTKGAAAHYWLSDSIGNILARSWEATPKGLHVDRVFDLLSAPLVGLDSFEAVTECLDPGSLVAYEDLPTPETLEIQARSKETVSFLLRGLRSNNGTTRNLAVVRLLPLVVSRSLSDEQKLEIGSLLWGESDPVFGDAEGHRPPFDWVFMILPEISPGKSEQSFRRKWLMPQTIAENDVSGFAQEMLVQLGHAIASREVRERLLPLTDEESEHISGLLLRFVTSFFGNSVTLGSNTSIRNLNTVAQAIAIPKPIAEELFKIIAGVLGTESIYKRDPRWPLGNPVYDIRLAISFSLIPGLVNALPDRIDTMALWLSAGLASGEEIRVNNAMVATRTWALSSPEGAQEIAPDNLVREVGAIIASRRQDALVEALMCAALIFDRGVQSHRDAITTFALHGLTYLAEEMQYQRYLDDEDVPTIRLLCVRLAISMARSGFGDEPIVVKWLDIGRDDPFPEVRNVVLSAQAGQSSDVM